MGVDFDGSPCNTPDALEYNLNAASPGPDEIAVAVEKADQNGESKKKSRKRRKLRDSRSKAARQDDYKDKKQDEGAKHWKAGDKDDKSKPNSASAGTKIKLKPSSDGTVDGCL